LEPPLAVRPLCTSGSQHAVLSTLATHAWPILPRPSRRRSPPRASLPREGDIDGPRNGGERAWIREIFAETDRKLAERHLPAINNADKQALLWYYEKDLYAALGYSVSRGKPADYADAAKKLLESAAR
jgi:hypothetical protein